MIQKIKNFLFTNTGNRQTVAKNAFWLFSGEIASRLIKLALIVYAARALGSAGWGIFAYAISVSSLLMIFSDIGLGGLITREATKHRENGTSSLGTILFLRFGLLALSIIAVFIVSPLISKIPEARVLFLPVAMLLFFDSLREFLFSYNRAFEKMEKEMVGRTLTNAIILILGVYLISQNASPYSLALSYALGSAFGFLFMLILVWKDLKKLFTYPQINSILPILTTILPFALITLTGTIMGNTDIYMLGIWKDENEIGLYSAVSRLYQFVLMIPAMIATATFPLISRLAKNDDHKFSLVLGRGLTLSMMIGLPISAGGIILAEKIILLVFGQSFIGATPIMQIFFIMIIFAFPQTLLSNAIFAYDKQKSLILPFTLGVIANVVINFMLIKPFGASGAAIATLISTAILTAIIWLKMKKIGNFSVIPNLFKSLIATLIMSLVALILKSLELHVVTIVVVSIITYILILLSLKDPMFKEIKGRSQI